MAGPNKESKIEADIRPVNTELYYNVHTPTNEMFIKLDRVLKCTLKSL